MALNFSNVKKWYIPLNGTNKEVKSVVINGTIVWKSGPEPYITFKADSQFTCYHTYGGFTGNVTDGHFEYSTDKINWHDWSVTSTGTSSSTVTSSANGYLFVRQRGGTKFSRQFVTSGATNLKVSGDIRMLINCENYENVTPSGVYMFKGCTDLVDVSDLIISFPRENCPNFGYMFSGCSNLRYVPKEMPYTHYPYQSCRAMFGSCASLTAAPKMTACTVGGYSMYSMFSGCSSLLSPPEGLVITGFKKLSGELIFSQACDSMFNKCTSLTKVVPLTMTTMADLNGSGSNMSTTFEYMYQYCTSLTQIPKINASGAYSSSDVHRMYYSTNIKAYTSSRSGYSKAFRIPWSATASTSGIKKPFPIDDSISGNILLNTTYYINNDVEIV